jgi:hypothetical protein
VSLYTGSQTQASRAWCVLYSSGFTSWMSAAEPFLPRLALPLTSRTEPCRPQPCTKCESGVMPGPASQAGGGGGSAGACLQEEPLHHTGVEVGPEERQVDAPPGVILTMHLLRPIEPGQTSGRKAAWGGQPSGSHTVSGRFPTWGVTCTTLNATVTSIPSLISLTGVRVRLAPIPSR